jgi:NIPSNAP
MFKRVLYTVSVFTVGLLAGASMKPSSVVHAQGAKHVYEIRTYTAAAGKLDALKARFRDHTIDIFNKHGMKSIGYWTPQDSPQAQNTLIYILEHPSRDEAKKNWAAFQSDPEWVKARDASQVDGKLVDKVDSVYADPTDFSPIK